MTERANLLPAGGAAAPSNAGGWTRAIIRALRARGFDGEGLAAEIGIDPRLLDTPEARVPMIATDALWCRAVSSTRDPSFGLYVSRFFTPAAFQLLGIAALTSSTLREAFHRAASYPHVIADALVLQIEDHRDRVRLVIDVTSGLRPVTEAIDAGVSLALRTARLLRERPEMSPLRVELRREKPAPSEPFRRFFRAPISFHSARNALEFSRNDFDAPLPNANAEVSRWIDQVLVRSVARARSTEIVGAVRTALIERLADGEPAQHVIARALGLSRRTLQRRLGEAGSSYQAVLAETRMALARSYLAEGRSVTDVAFAVGFSNSSSFSRAFRRWSGRPPSMR